METSPRYYDRLPVSIPVNISLDGNSEKKYRGEITNISMGGAFVHCVAPIQIGQTVLLEMEWGEAKVIPREKRLVPAKEKVKGSKLPKALPEPSVVRWVRGSSDSGFGVQFSGLQSDKQSFLETLISYMRSVRKEANT